jgi:hypothetical protein
MAAPRRVLTLERRNWLASEQVPVVREKPNTSLRLPNLIGSLRRRLLEASGAACSLTIKIIGPAP